MCSGDDCGEWKVRDREAGPAREPQRRLAPWENPGPSLSSQGPGREKGQREERGIAAPELGA